MSEVRESPCRFCPYRKDVPSGVWSPEEYYKLLQYDEPTTDQPMQLFGCHETGANGLLCAGWAQCHTNRGHAFDLLALRLHPKRVPKITTPLFDSAAEAAAHGLRDVKKPGIDAMRAAGYLVKVQAKQKRARKLKTK